MASSVLVVDDESDIRSALLKQLRRWGWTGYEAGDATEARRQVDSRPDIGIVLLDIRLPGQSGLEWLAEQSQRVDRDLRYVIVTGHGGMDEAISSLQLGASDFLLKPFSLSQVRRAIEKCDEELSQIDRDRRHRQALVRAFRSKKAQVGTLLKEVDLARYEALEALALAAEHRDDDTGAHIRRIGAFAEILANGLGWPRRELEKIKHAAVLHDVGKIGIADSILLKEGSLTEAEAEAMREHTTIGYRILSKAQSELMECAAHIALCHHERWDGSGYPGGRVGNEIPLEARMVAICDVYDALRSARPYKPPVGHAKAVEIILDGDGRTLPTHFDPELLTIFATHEIQFRAVYERCLDRGGADGPVGC